MVKVASGVSKIRLSGIEEMNELAKKVDGLINMGQGKPIFKTPLPVINAAKRALDEGHTKYTLSRGIEELRIALARKMADYNKIDATPEEILVTVGVSEGISISLLSYAEKGDKVIIPTPSHPFFRIMGEFVGAEVIEVPCKQGDFSLDIEAIEDLTDDKTKAIMINVPNNPTGKIYDGRQLKKLQRMAANQDFLVISDEIYDYIVFEKRHESIAKHGKENIITLSGFSKAYSMTGWRIGYMHSTEEIINSILPVHNSLVVSAPEFIQVAALKAVNDETSLNFVKATTEEYKKRRDLVVKRLNEIGLHSNFPEGAYYAFSDISSYRMDSLGFAKFLLKVAKVLCVPGISFGKDWDGYVRFSFADVPQSDLFEAMDRIEKVLKRV
ncbi:MAG TPA: pyridoxal phosphate-dependent aminotransferase [Methanofastidiosum sp.]|uniref:Aminotransferase n=1 Tax=Candidatus Methanofastidiosum methylothiophilum TaxID=1705564 RepID=A0A150J7X8_9EURY|nr:MAG: putative aspartate aminotransferase 2 [Candidatus Methanofastidiosum methylthiophilus]HNV93910.1 pyridoxal phosphate-dependent aminotransferase [Methanofastidiosum sp.]HNZ60175.1 pyridoxal phosphate-dependent aminotransferase [Methanofastidiosum sp.]HOE93598.1 pyridoxal phosphate-dependent aminotransferase [Methanofastidiosum sp.]HOR88736.1 pyridoxal phosphate-dependent aminotransferase [Methanofastidiosum sp.]